MENDNSRIPSWLSTQYRALSRTLKKKLANIKDSRQKKLFVITVSILKNEFEQ